MESRPLCVNYDVLANVGMVIRSYFLERGYAAIFNIRSVDSERSTVVENHPYEYGMDFFLASAELTMVSHMISRVQCFRDGAVSHLWESRVAAAIESVRSNYLYLLQPPHGSGRHRGGFRFDLEFNVERCFFDAVLWTLEATPYGLGQSTRELPFYTEFEEGRAAVVGSESYGNADVANLKRLKYEDGGLVREKDCAICFGEYESSGEDLALMPCTHSFHYHCIAKWLRMNPSCPLCRQEINHLAT